MIAPTDEDSMPVVKETKVADTIHVGLELDIRTLLGRLHFEVVNIDEESGTAEIRSGRTIGQLRRKEDGWYDQHWHGNVDAISGVKFI
jgi:hypothetical protein